MKIKNLLYTAAAFLFIYFLSVTGSGCAQIGAPTGGPRDSIPPVLVSAYPKVLSTNFTGNKITLVFDEYINVLEVQKNVIVSPYPKTFPVINFKLKEVSIKLKDTLLENTTYAINFGNAIVDNNENNPFKEFTYVFSTGNTIDSLKLSGKVLMAETGKPDSTLQALLYRNGNDSSVEQRKPNYIAKIDRNGIFTFTNLSEGVYKIYALKDGDGGKTYNSKIESFAFVNEDITINGKNDSVRLYAYEEEKDIKKVSAVPARVVIEKKLKYTSSLGTGGQQDVLTNLELRFNNKLKLSDSSKIILTDTNYNKIEGVSISLDSTRKNIIIKNKWPLENYYRLIIPKGAVSDSANNVLAKSDTIKFQSKKESDYGSLTLRFTKIDSARHPVIQFLISAEIVKSIKATGPNWTDKFFNPGEYELRILYDTNNNGVWDPGNYKKKIQPEHALTLDKKLTIKANWDNEREIEL
ncbi:Ig-like domain-containing domain [Ferruginibacter sp.]|uniref:Ig-like domain-containing domain n=1 Tax=Ferruginibacter sp. TaxID=1940288 RepID=UPI0019C49314|nr:Ig-like domain-containing domain [Ferruginibacter sp.]MBC7629360.1 Ig-like domain-containing protein [Ferruginibacter sp.]